MEKQNILSSSISKLTNLLNKPAIPCSFIATQLTHLLKYYSTGLTLHVAADEILSTWNHQNSISSPPKLPYRVGTIVDRTNDPEIWIIRPSQGNHVALFAHSSTTGRFQSNQRIIFSQPNCNSSALNHEALKIVKNAFQSAKQTKQVSNKKSNNSADSPVDVRDVSNSVLPQSADTPSQAIDQNELFTLVKEAVLPSNKIWYDLNTVNQSTIDIEGDMTSFTLQRVWNERSLQPKWIYAVVVQVQSQPIPFIRLQDPCDNPSMQPSVLWNLDESDTISSSLLKPGDAILLHNVCVEPTGDSFNISSTSKTIQYYKSSDIRNEIFVSIDDKSEKCDDVATRPTKRPRSGVDPNQSLKAFTTEQLSHLDDFESYFPDGCVILGRIVQEPKHEEDETVSFECENDTMIQVNRSDTSHIAKSIKAGDELLFHSVKKTKSDHGSSNAKNSWIASNFDNITTMQGILFAPFAYKISRLQSLSSLKFKDKESREYSTHHVCVHIKDVSLDMQNKTLSALISDLQDDADFSTKGVELDENHVKANKSASKSEEKRQSSSYIKIAVDSCYTELFGVTSDSFWSGNSKNLLLANLARLRKEAWVMTITINNSNGSLPLLRACSVRPV